MRLIGVARFVQIALRKMHDHAACTVTPLKNCHKLLILKDFFET